MAEARAGADEEEERRKQKTDLKLSNEYDTYQSK